MAKGNQISLDLTSAQVADLEKAVGDLNKATAYLISLTKKEKKGLKIMQDKSLPFVENALMYAQSDPKFNSSLVDLDEALRDLKSWKNIRSSAMQVIILANKFDDTLAALGSDAYRAALDIYDHLGKAGDRNIPGAKAAHNELKGFFERTKSVGDEPAPPPVAP